MGPLDHSVTEETPWGEAVSEKAQEGGGGLTWVFATDYITIVEEKFGRTVTEGHRRHPDGIDLKWKHIGVNEINDSRELPFSSQWLTADHPSQDGKAFAAIEKITIADTEQFPDPGFKSEILASLNGTDIEFIDPSTNESEPGIFCGGLDDAYQVSGLRLKSVRFSHINLRAINWSMRNC